MVNVTPRVGVLALQGAFREHCSVFRELGADVVEVRTPTDLNGCQALALPGGESTTMGKLLVSSGLEEPLRQFAGPLFGTCAGMILVAKETVDGLPGQEGFGLIDIGVRRNGYGRQVASFEGALVLDDGSGATGVFIRAPRIVRLGAGVDVLARLDDEPVAVAHGRVFATAFHPELTPDRRLHERFLALL